MSVRSLIVAIVVVLAGLVLASTTEAYPRMPQVIQGPFTVVKVVDGDTIHVDANGQRLKIRMSEQRVRASAWPLRETLRFWRPSGGGTQRDEGAVRLTMYLR
jgi:FlaG/FlaF family flagellin (archaellin)